MWNKQISNRLNNQNSYCHGNKTYKSELLYIEEHQSCQNYMTTIETGFKYLEFAKNVAFEEDNTTKNYLLFFLKGDFTICCNQFHNKLFHAGEMILIPRSSRLKGFAETDSSLLSMFSIYLQRTVTSSYYSLYQMYATTLNMTFHQLKYAIH